MTAHPAQPVQSALSEMGGPNDPPPPVKGTLNRLLFWIFPTNFSIFLMWGAIPGILLTTQVQNIDPANVVPHMMIVTVAGSICAMIAQPLAGEVSDRTRSKLGRRTPWMVLGTIVGGVGLLGLAISSKSLVMITIAWCVVQIAYNFVQGPLSAILPDRVPLNRRGTFSAIFGCGLMAGSTIGGIVGSQFIHRIPAAYILFAIIVFVVVLGFVFFNPDHSNVDEPKPPFELKEFLKTFMISPKQHPDFFWAFMGRLLLYIAYFAVAGYQLLILEHYIGLSEGKAADTVAAVGVVSLITILLSTAVGGPLSDKMGRRKPVVFVSSALMSLALIIPFFNSHVAIWYVYAAVMGLGFGAFQGVDTALMSEVLPSAESFGKDLGVVNIAATLPQVMAPFLAGVIVLVGGGGSAGYRLMFPVCFVFAVLGASCIAFIKGVR